MPYDYINFGHWVAMRKLRKHRIVPRTPLTDEQYSMLTDEEKSHFKEVDYADAFEVPSGGLVNRGGLAIVHGGEPIMPLDKLKEILQEQANNIT